MEREGGHWQARLPAELVEQVVWPVRMQAFHDDDVPASKWRGYDTLGLMCYYRHVYSRWSTDFDEAGSAVGGRGQPPCELQQQEDLEAWRTLLGTWVRRVQRMRRAHSAGNAADKPAVFDTGFELVTARAIPRL
ncbi:MAG TPA: hypothetical protein VET87_01275 [Rubrivivax sp.]|nr:hypothetical protein [Rubrivivax sp.]